MERNCLHKKWDLRFGLSLFFNYLQLYWVKKKKGGGGSGGREKGGTVLEVSLRKLYKVTSCFSVEAPASSHERYSEVYR